MYHILGHHHISMITKNAKQNNYFYEHILGLRRVNVTVSQDDHGMYHLFYGDRIGSPGTELTFFEIPIVGQTYRGTNAITRVGLIVPSEESLRYWEKRLNEFNVPHSGMTTYADRAAILLEDIDHLRLALVIGDGNVLPFWEAWEHSTVPEKHQLLGMGPIEMTVRRPQKLARTLTELFDYEKVNESEHFTRFQSIKDNQFGEIVVKLLDGPSERPGRGSVHHLAIRAENDEQLHYWDEQVKRWGFHSTGVIDRYYFKSLYFRESNGIMFEIATDGPGFTVNRDVNSLGEQLDLPPSLEEKRAKIEAKLTPLKEIITRANI